MSIRESVSLAAYKQNTKKEINEIVYRLDEIKKNVASDKNDYKTRDEKIRGIIGSFVWLGVFFAAALFLWGYTYSVFGVATLVAGGGLCLVMIIENITSLSSNSEYYTVSRRITELEDRLQACSLEILQKEQMFQSMAKKGWEYSLVAAESVYDEISAITMSLQTAGSKGKADFEGIKVFLYYTSVIAVALFSCTALYEPAGAIIEAITKLSSSSSAVPVILTIGLVIICIFDIFLARWVLSETIFVDNLTLLTVLAAPAAFMVLVFVGTLIVSLVIYILGVLLVLFIAYSCLCGG